MTRRNAWALPVVAALLALSVAPVGAADVPGTDYVMLVDNTGSMRTGHRAGATVEGLAAFIGLMSFGDRVSVFSYGERVESVFADYPVTVTDDVSRNRLINGLTFSFDADRTDITAALSRVWDERATLFRRHSGAGSAGRQSGAVVVLVTDGSLIPVYDDYSDYDAVFAASKVQLEGLAKRFSDEGIPVHILAVGRAEEVNTDLTRYVAETSGGTFTLVENTAAVIDGYVAIMGAIEHAGGSRSGLVHQPPQGDLEVPAAIGEGTSYTRTSSLADYLPPALLERYAAILAIFVGAVALGVDKRKPWALAFTRNVGRSDVRVRGYLRPVDPPGVFSARPIVGLENPGLPSIKVGVDTPYVTHARETTVEFVGTNDGTPPELIVEKGRVLVEGEEVTAPRQLRDGDLIEIEKVLYRYLRGNRR
ncbi:MAG: VWA domain-containing protein [Candidatus Eisenbacteria bacterium]|nr:VWA domain-containing protein [Candidatus Eisenbacteria bacterium]